MMSKFILGTAKKDLAKFDIVRFDDIEPIDCIESNDVHIFCRPCDFEMAKKLLQSGMGVIAPKEWHESFEKINGSVGYETDKMVKVTEQEFLSTIVDRSGVTVEQVGHKHKHYLFCGNHYASKIKGQYWVVDDVYKEIVNARNENE